MEKQCFEKWRQTSVLETGTGEKKNVSQIGHDRRYKVLKLKYMYFCFW